MSRHAAHALAIICLSLGLAATRADNLAFTGFANAYQTVDIHLSAPNTARDMTGSAHEFANLDAATDIGRLYAEGNAVNDAVSQEASQIAAWELAYETSGSYDLASGTATSGGGGASSGGALALATRWLGSLGEVASPRDLTVFASRSHRDQATAVPEPSTYMLMAACRVGIGCWVRRRT